VRGKTIINTAAYTVVLFLSWTCISTATDLDFPKTEAEMVEALSQKNAEIVTVAIKKGSGLNY
jgi:hypothetical protein